MVTGSGDIHVTGLKAGNLHANVTGSGDVTLTGAADRLHAEITGSGDLRAGDLAANEVPSHRDRFRRCHRPRPPTNSWTPT